MANKLAIALHAFGAESGSGVGPAVDIGARSALRLELRAAGVTDTLSVSVETSPDAVTWRDVGSFPSISTSAGTARRAFDRCDRYVRAAWPDGTSATFSVEGKAHALFAERGDLGTALPQATLGQASDDVIAAALIKASADVEDALGTVHDLPITAWSESVTHRAAAIAAYHIAMGPGFAGAGIDELLVKNADDARAWLKSVAKRELTPAGVEPEPDAGVQASSGIPEHAGEFTRRMSDNWGDF